jgi:hypothetical protein
MTPHRLLYLFPDRAESTNNGNVVLGWPQGENPFSSERPISFNPAVSQIVVRSGAFTPDECQKIRILGETRQPSLTSLEHGNPVDYRASTICWIEADPDAQWIIIGSGCCFSRPIGDMGSS